MSVASVGGHATTLLNEKERARKLTEHQNILVTEPSIHCLTRFQSHGPQLCTSLKLHRFLFQPSQRAVISSPPPPVLELSESRDLSNESEDGLTQSDRPPRPQTLRGCKQLLATIVYVEVDGGLEGLSFHSALPRRCTFPLRRRRSPWPPSSPPSALHQLSTTSRVSHVCPEATNEQGD